MSRIGKKTITLLDNVVAFLNQDIIIIKGPKGELSLLIPKSINIIIDNNKITLYQSNAHKKTKQLHGLYRTLINNMVVGVCQGFSKQLTLQGVGYRAQVNKKNLVLNVGYSHPIIIKPPEGVIISSENNIDIIISGIDKVGVGETAAKIRAVRPPEPYKGKGIRYQREFIRKKVGKTGK